MADPVNLIDPSGLFTEGYFGRSLSPNAQATLGAASSLTGAALLTLGYYIRDSRVIGAGVVLGYEGVKNFSYARDRGGEVELPWLNDLLRDLQRFSNQNRDKKGICGNPGVGGGV